MKRGVPFAVSDGAILPQKQTCGNFTIMNGAMNPELREIYNRFAATYESNRDQFDVSGIFDEFFQCLNTPNGHLLDVGCGAGEPFARWFLERDWKVTGVDFSSRMLELARHYVPQMTAIGADMCEVEFDKSTFDAVIAIYSLFHVPRQRHLDLFQKWQKWLRPDGKVLFTYATQEYTGQEEFDGTKEFLGEQLFYSHDSESVLHDKLRQSGLAVRSATKRKIGGETFLWVTAAKV
jgi:ubiquinone/menaquinone biosynthesis C-methylase UbiE